MSLIELTHIRLMVGDRLWVERFGDIDITEDWLGDRTLAEELDYGSMRFVVTELGEALRVSLDSETTQRLRYIGLARVW